GVIARLEAGGFGPGQEAEQLLGLSRPSRRQVGKQVNQHRHGILITGVDQRDGHVQAYRLVGVGEQLANRRPLVDSARATQHLGGDGTAQRQFVGQGRDQGGVGFAVAHPESHQGADDSAFLGGVLGVGQKREEGFDPLGRLASNQDVQGGGPQFYRRNSFEGVQALFGAADDFHVALVQGLPQGGRGGVSQGGQLPGGIFTNFKVVIAELFDQF